MRREYVFYGAELSYYSGKVRAYMRWKDIPFSEIRPSQEIYRNEIVPAVGYPVIPVIKLNDGTIIQDTTDIIDYFEAQMPEPSIYPKGPKQKLAALLLELYGDEWLVIPAMHYRWAYNKHWVVKEFGAALLPDADEEKQRALGEKVSQPFQGFVPLLGILPETVPGIEASYEALLKDLDAHFRAYDYLFGARPSIGDFGLIGPLYAHLYRDPKSGELMKHIAPHVVKWVERMQRPEQPLSGGFLENDAIPDTLMPVLKRMMREQMPVLKDGAEQLAHWNDSHLNEPLPRAIAMHEFEIEDCWGTRMIAPYSQWMLARARDFYENLDGEDLLEADKLLDGVNGGLFKNIEMKVPLKRENNRLCRA